MVATRTVARNGRYSLLELLLESFFGFINSDYKTKIACLKTANLQGKEECPGGKLLWFYRQ